jgi:hypothetical protein
MKLHSTVIENLIRIYTTYGGHRGESRLRQELSKVNLSTYTQQSGNEILVLTEELQRRSRQ